MRLTTFALLVASLFGGCQQESNPVADALLEALRDSPCTVKELKELYVPGLSVVYSRGAKGLKSEIEQRLVVDADETGYRYESHALAAAADAVKAKTGKQLTKHTWELALENIECAGLPTAATVTVGAGTFECLVYTYKTTMRGVEMKFRVSFAVKYPGLAVLREATAGIGVIRTELVGLVVPGVSDPGAPG